MASKKGSRNPRNTSGSKIICKIAAEEQRQGSTAASD
jgi:hypothetical protein